jgi:hypothetical protein
MTSTKIYTSDPQDPKWKKNNTFRMAVCAASQKGLQRLSMALRAARALGSAAVGSAALVVLQLCIRWKATLVH